eukprot:m.113836 g.113836  ORF g.113836 m.113836 type:complete len:246 (-) comp51880_c0_seq2:57-794(-)
MEAVVRLFGERVGSIKQSLQLRAAVDTHDLHALLHAVIAAEGLADEVEALVTAENKALAEAERTLESVRLQAQRCSHVAANLPTHLPHARGGALHTSSQPQPVLAQQNGKPGTSAGTSKGAVQTPVLAVVKVDEFESTPQYIRGRVSRDHVNDCIEAIHAAVAAKYKILAMQRSKLGAAVMKKYDAYKDAEADDTRGLCFFVDEDLKTLTEFKLDSAGRTCLHVLRHLGRLRENRSGGLVRFVLV